MSYRIRKSDDNQGKIVEALRKAGVRVHSTHTIGHGFPDLAVSYGGVNVFLEVKDGSKSPSRRALTEDELEWHRNWLGPVFVVSTPEEALRALGLI